MFKTIPDLIEINFKKYKNKKIFYYNNRYITYSEFKLLLDKTKVFLKKKKLSKNSKISVCMEKSLDQILIMIASISLNYVVVPILPVLKKDSISHIIKNSDTKLIITDQKRSSEIPDIYFNNVLFFSINQLDSVVLKNINFVRNKNLPNNPAFIIYSSGSTGMPKGIVIPHSNLLKGAKIVSSYLGTKFSDKILGILSFNFDYGLNQIWQTLYKACTLYLYDFFLPNDLVSFIRKNKITVLPLMPVIITLAFQNVKKIVSKKVRYICTSGGTVEKDKIHILRKIFPNSKIYLMYGLTEAFRSSYLLPSKIIKKFNSIGAAIPTVKLHILREDYTDCKVNEIGELVHRGGCISLGYYKDKKKTNNVFKKIKRFKNEVVVFSGDLVKKDKDGDIYFVGRKDHMIKTAGYRVSPTEVELQINKIKNIKFSLVTSVYDRIMGEKIICAYTTKNYKAINKDQLFKNSEILLPTHMQPKDFIYFKEFPITGNQGKINRPFIIHLIKEKFDNH
jgi:acyl-coenzyme A synthetase/AMP-(fatty) acid ligase